MGAGPSSVISIPLVKPRELNQGGTSTTKTVFTSDGTTPVICYLPNSGQLAGGSTTSGYSGRFRVKAWGRVVTSGTLNFTISLQYGTSATAASNTDIEDSGATSLASLTTNWFIEAELVWDNDSLRINGFGRAQVHTTYDAEATIDNAITSADPTGTTAIGFVVAGTFGTGAAGNLCYLDGFQIEQ